ncbi:hypothetical protein GJ496_004076 [Pomphorhynchus laevis]|nr:hypothetical protein GJ496_004076 [Pomphorhynchus laevis]
MHAESGDSDDQTSAHTKQQNDEKPDIQFGIKVDYFIPGVAICASYESAGQTYSGLLLNGNLSQRYVSNTQRQMNCRTLPTESALVLRQSYEASNHLQRSFIQKKRKTSRCAKSTLSTAVASYSAKSRKHSNRSKADNSKHTNKIQLVSTANDASTVTNEVVAHHDCDETIIDQSNENRDNLAVLWTARIDNAELESTINDKQCPSLETISEYQNSNSQSHFAMEAKDFSVGSVVWGKLAWSAWWPGRIVKLLPKSKSAKTAVVRWYGATTSSELPLDSLNEFVSGFCSRFRRNRKGNYRTAVIEAFRNSVADIEDQDYQRLTIMTWLFLGSNGLNVLMIMIIGMIRMLKHFSNNRSRT